MVHSKQSEEWYETGVRNILNEALKDSSSHPTLFNVHLTPFLGYLLGTVSLNRNKPKLYITIRIVNQQFLVSSILSVGLCYTIQEFLG